MNRIGEGELKVSASVGVNSVVSTAAKNIGPGLRGVKGGGNSGGQDLVLSDVAR